MKTIAEEFERLHAEFAEAVLACRAKADSKAVHRLRKIARMTEALLRKATEDHAGAGELKKRAKKTEKELKRIRRAAGPVRDLDVHVKIAKKICGLELKSASPEKRADIMREHASLDAKLTRRRQSAQKELQDLLAQREVKMERSLKKTAEAMHALLERDPGKKKLSVLATATEWVQRIPLPTIDPESLHGYRKKTKAVRYLASMYEGSAAAQKLEKRLKRMQDAIGHWHDLLLLAKEAKDVLGSKACITIAAKDAEKQALKRAVRSIELNK